MLRHTLKISLLAAAIAGVGLAHAEVTAPQTYADQTKAMQAQFEAQRQQAEKFHAAQLEQMKAVEAQYLAALKANPHTAHWAALREQMEKDFAAHQAAAAQRQTEFTQAHQARVATLRKPAPLTALDTKAQDTQRAEVQKQIEAQRAEMQKQIEAQRKQFESQAQRVPAPVTTI